MSASTGSSSAEPDTVIVLKSVEITNANKVSVDGKHVKLLPRAGSTATLTRAKSFTGGSLFTIKNSGSLVLAGNGNSGLLVMDGNKTNVTASASLLTVSGGSLTVSAGVTLQNNKNAGNGGGVCVSGSSSSFTMDGGEISGNTAYSEEGDGYGGGVYVTGSGNFKMTDGSISGNVADGKLMEGGGGGGVCVSGNGSNFTMSGGTIGGNTANSGGGVHVKDSGKFTKENGGTIYGSDNSTEKNSAYADDYGHAASVSGSKKRNSTAGTGTDLDSSETTNWD